MRITEIINWLGKEGIDFSISDGLLDESTFFPASIKQIVDRGIYYLTNAEVINKFEIENSLIFTSELVECPTNIVLAVENPQLVHYKLSQLFMPEINYSIHPTAIISSDAQIADEVSIGPYCVIGNSSIGSGTILKNHVVIEDKVTLGKNVIIDSGSAIGAGGLAWIWDEQGNRILQPQLGGVIIEDDCIIATDVTVVKGSLSENTRIRKGTVIAHGTKIGHGSQIGKYVHMANNVSLAGNAVIGDYSFLGSASIISSNIKISSNTIVGAGALVTKNFEQNYITLAGVPAKVIKENNYKEKPNGAPKPFKE